MIIKNLTRKSGTGTLFHYLFKYIANTDKMLESKPFIVRHNIRSNTIAGYITEFEQNEKNRIHKRKNSIKIHHVIISWARRDAEKLTDVMLRDMAKEFIKLRGQNNLYIITKHIDCQHIHLHAAVSASQINGKSSRMSKYEFEQLKKSMDLHQKLKYPELISLPAHGKQKEVAKAWHRMQQELLQLERIRNNANRELELEPERVRTFNKLEFGIMEQTAFNQR